MVSCQNHTLQKNSIAKECKLELVALLIPPVLYRRLTTVFLRPTEIPSINLRNAQYYRFNAPTFSQVASGSTALRPLGTNDALASLREKGCSLATPAWVDNHWAMILWKLASLICACPDLLRDKWTYHEVVNQLLYRCVRSTTSSFSSATRPTLCAPIATSASLIESSGPPFDSSRRAIRRRRDQ